MIQLSIKSSSFSNYKTQDFSKLISKQKLNVIILPTNNKATLELVITELKKLRNLPELEGSKD